jgi:hypothetical protein
MFCPFAVMADAARRRLEFQRENGLHRVDDDERRPDASDLFEDPFETRFSEKIQRRLADVEAFAARFDLVLGLFARRVQHRSAARHVRRCLEQERRLADAGLAAEQHERSRHDTPAEHAIEFVDAGREARVLLDLDVRVQTRGAGGAGQRVAMRGRRGRVDAAVLRRPLLDVRVPRAAVATAAKPLRRLRSAFLTDEDWFRGFSHRRPRYSDYR